MSFARVPNTANAASLASGMVSIASALATNLGMLDVCGSSGNVSKRYNARIRAGAFSLRMVCRHTQRWSTSVS